MAEYVYLIETVDRRYTKIGVSIEPRVRIRELQHTNPIRLFLRYTLDCGDNDAYKTERWLHLKFAQYRIYGEWFELSADEIAQFITDTVASNPYWRLQAVPLPNDWHQSNLRRTRAFEVVPRKSEPEKEKKAKRAPNPFFKPFVFSMSMVMLVLFLSMFLMSGMFPPPENAWQITSVIIDGYLFLFIGIACLISGGAWERNHHQIDTD